MSDQQAGSDVPRAFHPSPAAGPYLEPGDEVSAVFGAPSAGAPRSAFAAVSAQQIPRPHAAHFEIVAADGSVTSVHSDAIVVGRAPRADAGAQAIPVEDARRTVSKTHARLDFVDGQWMITDLDSTNGVALIDAAGKETVAAPGRAWPVSERFCLGECEVAIRERMP